MNPSALITLEMFQMPSFCHVLIVKYLKDSFYFIKNSFFAFSKSSSPNLMAPRLLVGFAGCFISQRISLTSLGWFLLYLSVKITHLSFIQKQRNECTNQFSFQNKYNLGKLLLVLFIPCQCVSWGSVNVDSNLASSAVLCS